jgi:putative tricarboxylic transport membrane protein
MSPLILGFILGGMLEQNLRRSVTLYDGSISFLWDRPITLTILVITGLVLLMPLVSSLRKDKNTDDSVKVAEI